MAAAVLAVPPFGGALELFIKAGIGAVVYAAVAYALDAGGARQHSSRLIRMARSVA